MGCWMRRRIGFASRQHPVRFPKLPDDLLRNMALPFHENLLALTGG